MFSPRRLWGIQEINGRKSVKFFQRCENSIYQWRSGKYVVYVFCEEKQGLFLIIKKDNHFVSKISEHDIENLNINQLKKLPIDRIKSVLNAHYVRVSQYSDGDYKVTLHVRGCGGWGEKVHKLKTAIWCQEMGMNKKDAKQVAKACNGVDFGSTDPISHALDKDAQSWHFNKHHHGHDGEPTDTRIRHAVDNLSQAIDLLNNNSKLALIELGKGLHPLQDLFAHIEIFVESYLPCKINPEGHVFHMRADDPKHINYEEDSPLSLDWEDKYPYGFSQRYTSTKLLTKFYVKQFLIKQKMNRDMLSTIVKEALAFSKNAHKQNQGEQMRRFQDFKHTLGLGPDLAAINDKVAKL